MKDARAKLAYLLTLILCVLFVLGGCSRDGEGGTESGEREPVPDRSGWLNVLDDESDTLDFQRTTIHYLVALNVFNRLVETEKEQNGGADRRIQGTGRRGL